MSYLTGLVIEPKTCRTDSDTVAIPTGWIIFKPKLVKPFTFTFVRLLYGWFRCIITYMAGFAVVNNNLHDNYDVIEDNIVSSQRAFYSRRKQALANIFW